MSILLQNHEEGTSLSPTCGEQRRPCDFSPRLKGHSTGMCVLAMRMHDGVHDGMPCSTYITPKKKPVDNSLNLKSRNIKKNMKYHWIFFQSSTYWQYVWCQKKITLLLHPWRITWNIIMEVWKIIFLSKWVICRFHVNLPGCIPIVWS